MNIFQVVGKGRESGRARTRKYKAKNEAEARGKAAADGTDVDEVIDLGPEPPTEPQLSYAESLGIAVDSEYSFAEVSDLITNRTEDRRPAPPHLRTLARELGYDATRFCAKETIEENLFRSISIKGKICLFLFLLLKSKSSDSPPNDITSPCHPGIAEIADRLKDDPKFLKSLLQNYHEPSLDGIERSQSYAYTRAALELKPILSSSRQKGSTNSPKINATNSTKSEGVKPAVWIGIVFAVILLYLLL